MGAPFERQGAAWLCERLLVIYVKAQLLLLPVGCSRINIAGHTTQNKPHLKYLPTSLCMQQTTAEHLAGSQNDDGQEFRSLAHHALTINQPSQTICNHKMLYI